MDAFKKLQRSKKLLTEAYIQNADQIEKLRIILEKEQGRPYSYKEARQLGTEIVDFYMILAQGKSITKGGLKNKKL